MENGLTEEKIADLDGNGASFSAREALAVEYAERLAVDHHNIDDGFSTNSGQSFLNRKFWSWG